jgi:hypothetical protein
MYEDLAQVIPNNKIRRVIDIEGGTHNFVCLIEMTSNVIGASLAAAS